MSESYLREANDRAVYAPFLYAPDAVRKDGVRVHESEHLQEVMEAAPGGAIVVCAIAVAVLVLTWLSAVLLLLARGSVG